MRQHGFEPDFPAEVQQQLADLRSHPPQIVSGKDVRDLRDLLWSSIDNDTSRDLDQIEVAERLPNGDMKVLVGIADVDAFVPEAVARSTSTPPARPPPSTPESATFPMLPEALSTGRTSLLENAGPPQRRHRIRRRRRRQREFQQRLSRPGSQQGAARIQRRGRVAGRHRRRAGQGRRFRRSAGTAEAAGRSRADAARRSAIGTARSTSRPIEVRPILLNEQVVDVVGSRRIARPS